MKRSPTKQAPPNATLQLINVPKPILEERDTTAVGSISGSDADSFKTVAESTKAILLEVLNAQVIYLGGNLLDKAGSATKSSIETTFD